MAAYQPFVIAPYDNGLVRDKKPWLIPDDAFSILRNAYVFRSRIVKRWGTSLISPPATLGEDTEQIHSRVRVSLGSTDGSGNFGPTAVPSNSLSIGHMFSVEDTLFTVNATGSPVATLAAGTGTASVDTAAGTITISAGPANATVYWYPGLPIMGICRFERNNINKEQTIVFDTRYAYRYSGAGYERLNAEAAAGDATWTGDDTDFFWCANYRGASPSDKLLFVTNFVPDDGIRTFNNSQWEKRSFPFNSAGDTIVTARLIVQFKNRLLLLNTVEQESGSPTTTTHQNRCRFSQNGSPFEADAWFEPPAQYGKGDRIDAPTSEAIISAEFLRDRLIVFFERSTWELVYTGNQVLPFVWQQINTELGAESTFSIVPFDKAILGIGDVGIHACTGANVERIDEKIPDEVFSIHNANDGVERIFGIRDYDSELVYWTFPSISTASDPTYPNRILSYNYKNGSWAFFDDSITAFGYYQPDFNATWASSTFTWEEATWAWNSGILQSEYRKILAGNQQGYVFTVESKSARNAPSLQATDIQASGIAVTLTVINNNLSAGDYILVENAQGITSLNDQIFLIDSRTRNTVTIIVPAGVVGTYTGGGTIARVSEIDIRTKPYNFFTQHGMNTAVNRVDFNVSKTSNGEITVDYFLSFSSLSMVDDGIQSGTIQGTNILETRPYATSTFEHVQTQLWHPVYFYAEGETVGFRLYWSDEQMSDPSIVLSNFELHAMIIHAQPGSSRLQ